MMKFFFTTPMYTLFRIVTVVALAAISLVGKAEVKLPQIWTDHMVLQRDKPINVWGWAAAGEAVRITFGAESISVKANKAGKWSAQLPAMAAGGPFVMTIEGKNKITLTDILVGDVWVCSGQSNMQWRIDQTGYEEKDNALIENARIRLFNVYVDTDYLPREDVKGSGWKNLTRQNINEFSAVAYHFGKYLHGELQVPIGLISDNLGATNIEAWMSNEALLQFPQFKEELNPVLKRNKNFAALRADFEKMKPAWYDKYYYKGVGIDQQWFKPETDVTDWKPIKALGNTWTDMPDLKDHDGEVWFRTTFDLPDNYSQSTFHVGLLQIDDYDIAWVNGVKVGENYGKHNHHGYDVPLKVLKPKGNVLVVRVFDAGGIGGFTTNAFWAANSILLGDWVYKKGSAIDAAKFPMPVVPNATPFSSPAVLYNGSIAPLTPMSVKGVIWYQGEGNAGRAYEYRELFPAMIKDWRKQWKQPDLPFLFVQLANYLEESAQPQESDWAELREAQAMTLSLPHTGMATAVDIGEANDIHPKNKRDVGIRLGLAAMNVAYGQNRVVSGPSFRQMREDSGRIIIEYDNAETGLTTRDKYGYVRGFQVAGVDHKFHWAQAFVEGNHVVVTCREVPRPVAVRYAWDNNPGNLDLYNKEGLPALPFRIDAWTGVTAGKVFTEGPRF
jgi:sialate O-acetylesterase